MNPEEPPHIPDYRLVLDVDFDARRWSGSVGMSLPEGTPSLDLDVDGLEVRRVRSGESERPFEVGDGWIHVPTRGLPTTLSIDFAGTASTQGLIGLYQTRRSGGYALTTQCEPIGARRIFPCLDRPDRKSAIHLTVRTRPDLEVIANTEAVSTRLDRGQKEWVFAPTPPMSAYLFYLGIGEWDRAENRSGRVPVRVLSAPGLGQSGAFAAEAGHRVLEACEGYYAIPYPLPKLDMIAVADHAFGAMENWGAISYREVRLLLPADAPTFQRRDVFETVAHEIAHMWFGNLVTMASWDDIWLNESFAALMETRITERLDPSLETSTDYFLRVAGMAAALDGDSLPSTHPVRTRVRRPEEITQIFDEITYGKGAGVLAMLESYLGEERFRAGVTDYLQRFRYGNARTENLWEALEKASGEPVRQIVGPWIDRPGHPVVTARLASDGLHLSQARFAYLPKADDEPPWPIPLVLDVDGERRHIIFDRAEQLVPVPAGAVVHLNPGGVGFYRVRYSDELRQRLMRVLPSRPSADRWIVLEDLGAFLFSGDADWATYADAVRALSQTTDRLVLESMLSTLGSLTMAFPEVRAVREETLHLLHDRLDAIGLDRAAAEPPSHGVLRERLASLLARLDSAFARELAPRFDSWTELDPDLRGATAVAVARTGGRAGWERLRAGLREPRSEADLLHLERAMCWSPEPELIEATLDLALDGTIRSGHINQVAGQVAHNPEGCPVLWTWMTRNLRVVEERLRGSGLLSILLEGTLPMLGLRAPAEVRRYFAEQPFPDGSRGIAKGEARLRSLEIVKTRLPPAG